MRIHAGGRSGISTQKYRYICLLGKRNRNATPDQIASDIANAAGTCISARAISRRLNNISLDARKYVTVITLQAHHFRESLL